MNATGTQIDFDLVDIQGRRLARKAYILALVDTRSRSLLGFKILNVREERILGVFRWLVRSLGNSAIFCSLAPWLDELYARYVTRLVSWEGRYAARKTSK